MKAKLINYVVYSLVSSYMFGAFLESNPNYKEWDNGTKLGVISIFIIVFIIILLTKFIHKNHKHHE